jgi:hypothetical protein
MVYQLEKRVLSGLTCFVRKDLLEKFNGETPDKNRMEEIQS